MINQEQLTHLLADLESDHIERTRSTNKTDKFAQAVCAFANDLPNHRKPGYLVVGVDDKGKPVGIQITDQLLQNLGALRSDGNIQPLPAINVAKFSLQDGDVTVVEVQPSDLPPVRYKGQVWIRIGPRKAIASEQEERILTERRIARARSFDASPISEASLKNLALSQFQAYRQEVIDPEIIEANHRSIEEQLASLRFFDSQHNVPTVAGILLFGKNPRYYLPGAYIQYLKLPATGLTDRPDDQAEVSGDLLSVLRELDTRLKSNIHTRLEPVSALREHHIFDYPEVAVRELLLNPSFAIQRAMIAQKFDFTSDFSPEWNSGTISEGEKSLVESKNKRGRALNCERRVNAIMHRNYQSNTPVRLYWFADRIEILSPGGLYGEVTPETLDKRSSYRNPILAEAMKALGYVNRYGYGIQRAKAAMEKNGNPPIRFEVDDRTFLAVLPRRET